MRASPGWCGRAGGDPFQDSAIAGQPAERLGAGSLVPRAGAFRPLTVGEHPAGRHAAGDRRAAAADMERMLALFPI
jgi:hypothetical protein